MIRQTDSTSTRSSYPWRASETGLYLASDRDLEPMWSIAPAQALLGLDGVFLHRDGLREYWMFSIFFDTDFTVSVARMAARDGVLTDSRDPRGARYVGDQGINRTCCDQG